MLERRVRWMSLNPGNHRIRLVGNHMKFFRLGEPSGLIVHCDMTEVWDELKRRDLSLPLERFAIHVLDRNDGRLKLLEDERLLFKQFARYKVETGINPAGKDGPDFSVSVDQDGKATVKALAITPFSEEEIALIKKDKYPLKGIYSSVSEDAALRQVETYRGRTF